MKMLERKLKISLTLRFMTKEEQKRPLATAKNKKVTGLMNNERGGKMITKFSTTAPKTCSDTEQKDDHEMEGSQFKKTRQVKKSSAKELKSYGFDKCVQNVTNNELQKL